MKLTYLVIAHSFFFFFFNHIYCARGTIPKLHIKAKGGGRESVTEESTNQIPDTTRAVSVPSPRLSAEAAQGAGLSQPVTDTLLTTALDRM